MNVKGDAAESGITFNIKRLLENFIWRAFSPTSGIVSQKDKIEDFGTST